MARCSKPLWCSVSRHLLVAVLCLTGCQASPLPGAGRRVQFEPLVPSARSAPDPMSRKTGSNHAAQMPLYGALHDHGHLVLAVPEPYLPPQALRQDVMYRAPYPPGTIVVDTAARHLYHLTGGGRAMRYVVGVGAAGQAFSGEAVLNRKRLWPRWTPTAEMLRRDPGTYGPWRRGMEGGGDNPLGARALYLSQNGRDTLYRIHGTPHPFSVGQASSNGCIRMFNQDVIHLAEKVQVGARVVVLNAAQSGRWVAQ